MAATTTLLGLLTPTQGTLSGAWGDSVNYGISDYVDISVAGTLTLINNGAVTLANTTGSSSGNSITFSLTGAGTVTAQFAIVRVTGTLTVAKVVTGPSYSKTYTVVNAATGGIVTFKASGQTGVSVAVGESAFVYYNGTDYVKIVGTATAGAAGGSTTQVQYNNAGVLAGITGATTNGTALTLVAPNLGSPSSVGTMPAFTLGGTVAGGGNQINNVIIGASTPLAGSFTTGNFTSGSSTPAIIAQGAGAAQGQLQFGSNVQNYRIQGGADYGAFNFEDNGVTRAKISSTGLAVTGAISATTPIATTSGGTGLTSFTSGGVVFASSTSALATGSGLVFDGSNLGLGVTPSAWYSTARAFQMGTTGSVYGRTGNELVGLSSNAYNSGAASTTFAYVVGGNYATNYLQTTGQHQWFTAGVGSNAGDTIFFTQAMTLNASGNLGIGTSSPTAKLDVRGATGNIHLESSTGTNGAFLEIKNTGGTYYFGVEDSAGTGFGCAPYALIDWVAAGRSKQTYIEAFGVATTVSSTGNFGIGTSSPTQLLDVTTTGATTATIVAQNTTATNGGAALRAGNPQNLLIMGTDSNSGGLTGTANASYFYTTSTSPMLFLPNGTERMRLDSSGNLLVGTTSNPFAGRGVFQVATPASGVSAAYSVFSDGTKTAVLQQTGSAYSYAGVGANALWLYTNSNYSTISIGSDGAVPITFVSSGSERMRLDSNGNLLVGTMSGPSTVRLNILSSSSDSTAYIRNSNATPYGINIKYTGATPNQTGSEFLYLEDSTALRMAVRSNGGLANYQANNVNLSDRREKTNFSPATSYLDKICSIPVQTFNYIDQDLVNDGGLTLGVVAQDVQAVAPELVTEGNWGTKDEPKMRLEIYQTDLQYALMKALQELNAKFEAYKASHP